MSQAQLRPGDAEAIDAANYYALVRGYGSTYLASQAGKWDELSSGFTALWEKSGKNLATFKAMLAPSSPVMAGNEQPGSMQKYMIGIPLLLIGAYAFYRLIKAGTI